MSERIELLLERLLALLDGARRPVRAGSKNAERCRRYRERKRLRHADGVSPDHVTDHVATCSRDMGGQGGEVEKSEKNPQDLGFQVKIPGEGDMVATRSSDMPPRPGSFGMEAQAWADGVRSKTGSRPDLPARCLRKLEEIANARPLEAEDGVEFMRLDGARFAAECQRARRWKVNVWVYIDWVAGGRLPMLDERGRTGVPIETRPHTMSPPVKTGPVKAEPPPADLFRRAGLA